MCKVHVLAAAMLVMASSACASDPPPPGAPSKAGEAPPLVPLFPSPVGADSKDATQPITPLAHVEVMGRGPIPMVLIPGLGCDWTIFKTFMERNADRYTMYAVTLPGFGRGKFRPPPSPNDDYCSRKWLKNAVRAIAQEIEQRGIERPVVVGHGMGGHLALWLALEFPQRIRSVVSMEGFPIVPMTGREPRGTVEGRRFQIKENILPSFQLPEELWRKEQIDLAERLVTDDRRAREIGLMLVTPPRQVSLRYQLEFIVSDLTQDMERNSVPILFIAAEFPQANPMLLRRFHFEVEGVIGAPPKTQLLYFENCRSFVMDEDPARLDRTVDLFVRGERIPGAKGAVELQEGPVPPADLVPNAPRPSPPPPPPGGSPAGP